MPSVAQKSKELNLDVNASANFAINEGYPLWGFGSHLKLSWPTRGKRNSFFTTIGVDKFREDFDIDGYTYTFLLSSFGYRINQRSFFVETQVGFGGNHESDYSSICGFIGIEPGIQRKRWIFSIDYRFISSDGFIEGDHFHALSFKTGFRIFGDE